MFNRVGKTLFLASSLAAACCARADNAEDSNKSNNPLNVAPGANLQDYSTPRLYDSNAHTHDVLLRGPLPIAPNDFIGVPQLIRATLPISTRPDPHSGYSTGIGDLNLFAIFIVKTEGVQLGVGPLITAPLRLLGALVQYQSSLAGDTVDRKGDGLPQFTLYAGLNVTLGN
ncbi:hypothetical protein [Pseudomonas protegens]